MVAVAVDRRAVRLQYRGAHTEQAVHLKRDDHLAARGVVVGNRNRRSSRLKRVGRDIRSVDPYRIHPLGGKGELKDLRGGRVEIMNPQARVQQVARLVDLSQRFGIPVLSVKRDVSLRYGKYPAVGLKGHDGVAVEQIETVVKEKERNAVVGRGQRRERNGGRVVLGTAVERVSGNIKDVVNARKTAFPVAADGFCSENDGFKTAPLFQRTVRENPKILHVGRTAVGNGRIHFAHVLLR